MYKLFETLPAFIYESEMCRRCYGNVSLLLLWYLI